MSGKRCKALRREFKKKTGCAPERALTRIVPRILRFFGKNVTVQQLDIISPSEWRQIKKAHQARRAA